MDEEQQQPPRPGANRIPFPAAEPSYRAARLRCAIACRDYNSQPENASAEHRARLWSAIVSAPESHQLSGTPPLLGNNTIPRQTPTTIDTSSSRGTEEVRNLPKANPAINGQARVPGAVSDNPDTFHLPEPHLHHIVCTPGQHTESRLGPSIPTSDIHSPPPSPSLSLLEDDDAAALPAQYVSADTPPPSRRASSPDLVIRDPSSHAAVTLPNSPFTVNAPYIKPPLYIDYGTNLHIAPSTFINRNFTVIDSPIAKITIGERCLIGPNTTLASITHPLDAAERAGPLGAPSSASEISIGDDCWVGASVNILDGVKIGAGCVIGAGSVVTKNIPAGHLAVGVPARVIRKVTASAEDRTFAISQAEAVSCHPGLSKDPALLTSSTTLTPSDFSNRTVLNECACCAATEAKIERLDKTMRILGVMVALFSLGVFWFGYRHVSLF